MTTTTAIGTWCNFGDSYSTSVESTIADYLNGGDSDWRTRMEESGAVDAIAKDYRDAIDAAIPAGISLCGDQFIADVDVDYDVEEMKAAIEEIDLAAIIERHDVDA